LRTGFRHRFAEKEKQGREALHKKLNDNPLVLGTFSGSQRSSLDVVDVAAV